MQQKTIKPTTFLAIAFFFSGSAGLIYQVIWQRLLTLYYGVGNISISLIVSVFMFGLGLGALIGGYFSERIVNKIKIYCLIELFLGIFGLLSLPFLKYLGQMTAGSPYLLTLIYVFIFLSFPTVLMGMTLPLLIKIYNSYVGRFLYSVSFLYFINTLGASVGALVASYIIISLFGLNGGIYAAATINLLLAALLMIWFRNKEIENKREPIKPNTLIHDAFGRISYFLIFITGFLAIGYEIVWFRLIGVIVKASPYAFSTILSIYLLGIAFGSFWMDKFCGRHPSISKKSLFYILQFAIGFSVFLIITGYIYLTEWTDFSILTRFSFEQIKHPAIILPDRNDLISWISVLYSWVDIFFWAFFFVFIPTFFMGASFPLISSLAMTKPDTEGHTVGMIYFFNIIGNVLGGLCTGFVVLPLLGTEHTLLVFISIGISFLIFANGKTILLSNKFMKAMIVGFCIIFLIILFPGRGKLYSLMHPQLDGYQSFFEEGIDGTIMTYQNGPFISNYINGSGHGGRPIPIFYYESLAALGFSQKAENALIIGFGTGSFVETLALASDVASITLVELNNTLLKNLKKIPVLNRILTNEKLKIIIDDGRRYLLRTDKIFDIIMTDPLRSTTAYSNNLYSYEFFQIVKKHLSKGGVFVVWMDEYHVIPKTVINTFNHVRIYDQFCIASDTPLLPNNNRINLVLNQFPKNFQKNIIRSARYIADQKQSAPFVREYPMNRDFKPVCEYYLGLKLKTTLNFFQ